MNNPKGILDIFQYQVDTNWNKLKKSHDAFVRDNKVYLDDHSFLEGFSLTSDAKIGEEYEIYVKGAFVGKLIIKSDLYYKNFSIRRDTLFLPDAPIEYITVTINI